MTAEHVSGIVEKHAGSRGGLIAILQEIQARYGYLPAEALKKVAAQTGRPLVDVYGVATFYHRIKSDKMYESWSMEYRRAKIFGIFVRIPEGGS